MKRRRFYNAINKKSGTETLRIELLEDQVVFNIIFWGDQGLWDSFGHWSICFVISTWCFQRCCWTFFTPVLAWLFFPILIDNQSILFNQQSWFKPKKAAPSGIFGLSPYFNGGGFPGYHKLSIAFFTIPKNPKKNPRVIFGEAKNLRSWKWSPRNWRVPYNGLRMEPGLWGADGAQELSWLVGWLVQKTTWAFNKPGWLVIIVRGWLVGWLVGY